MKAPCLSLLLLLWTGSLLADPQNFMVSDFTFVRPVKWKWIETGVGQQAQLQIATEDTNQVANVNFYLFKPTDSEGTPANTAFRWRKMFDESPRDLKFKTEHLTINKHKLTYVNIEGSFKTKGAQNEIVLLSDHSLRGAIIEYPSGNILVRMIGPKELVAKARPEFNKMVSTALMQN